MAAADLGLLRKMLALSVTSDLIWELPAGAIKIIVNFGQGSPVQTSRTILAEAIDEFRSEAAIQEIPGWETIETLVTRRSVGLRSPEERSNLDLEWRAVRSMEITDPSWMRREAWTFYRAATLGNALMAAADHVSKRTPEALDSAYSLLREHFAELGASSALRVPPTPIISSLYEQADLLWSGEDDTPRVPTGLGPLDHALAGGPMIGEAFYVLAPPKGAKSTFLINVALGATRHRHSGVFFSYEMRERPMIRRFHRGLANASAWELRDDPNRLRKVFDAYRAAGAGEIFLREGSTREKDACGVVERYVDQLRAQGRTITFAVLDYLNIMGSADENSRKREKRHELAQISREMSALAKNAGLVVWSAALVKREAVAKKRVTKTDISEAFEVIAVCDGAVAICAPKEVREAGQCVLWAAALREAEDEKELGVYTVDGARMRFMPSSPRWAAEGDEVKEGGIDS